MKVRNLTRVCSTIVTLGITASAALADGGISTQMLDQMGLGGMTILSDDQAMGVRGAGYLGGSSAAAFGNSFATISSKYGNAHSENGYSAEGKRFAKGSNHSFAGAEIKKSNGGHQGAGMKSFGRKGGGPKGWAGTAGRKSAGKFANYGDAKPGGYGGAKHKVTSIKVFAGGFSSAKAR